MTFLAVRRWFGWSAGRLLVLDIGGGSLEIAAGIDEEPDVALSAAAGRGPADPRAAARRPAGPPAQVEKLREYVDEQRQHGARQAAEAVGPAGRPPRRRSGRWPGWPARRRPAPGLRARAELTLTGLRQVLGFIRQIPPAQLAEMEGVSAGRAHQLLAGAVVAEAAMRRLGMDSLDICPWALREGVILRRLDVLDRS